MCIEIKNKFTEWINSPSESFLTIKGSLCGRQLSCELNKKNMLGIVALVFAACALLFGVILASGTFGAGKTAFFAGALTICSVIGFAIAAHLLLRRSPDKTQTTEILNN